MDIKEFCEYTGADEIHANKFMTHANGKIGVAMQLWATAQGSSCTFPLDEEDAVHTGWTNIVEAMKSSTYGKIMDIMKRIQTLCTETKLQLPRIVVIGSESSGKSSTLERIAGLALFPRNSTICTRMPIILRLINTDSESMEAKDSARSVVILKHYRHADIEINENEASATISKLMNDLVPSGAGVIDEPLTIEVRKKSVPTLEMIDLPGVVAASIAGEPSDMMQRTRNITEKYLRCEDTIVVAVVPANITRVRDSQAMQMIQANRKEDITIGVLAKCDLSYDPRFKQHKQSTPYWQLEKRLAGEADDMISLSNGWLAVKNRDTQIEEEETSDFSQSLEIEQKWFASEAHISKEICDGQCGVDALLKRIDDLFTKHFRCTWVPKAISHIETKMADVKRNLMLLGPSPKLLSLGEVLDAFIAEFGRYSLSFSEGCHVPITCGVNSAIVYVQTHWMEKVIESIDENIRRCFLSHRKGLCLYRFEVICEKVLEVVKEIVISRMKGVFFWEKLKGLFQQVHYTAVVFHGNQVHDGNALSGLVMEIIREELVQNAVVKNMEDVKRSVVQRLFDDNHHGANRCNSTDSSNGLLESCAVTRANLATEQFNLFTALKQLKKIQGAVEGKIKTEGVWEESSYDDTMF
eukprot:5484254-Pleurochrysis_carterae.AAC.1